MVAASLPDVPVDKRVVLQIEDDHSYIAVASHTATGEVSEEPLEH